MKSFKIIFPWIAFESFVFGIGSTFLSYEKFIPDSISSSFTFFMELEIVILDLLDFYLGILRKWRF